VAGQWISIFQRDWRREVREEPLALKENRTDVESDEFHSASILFADAVLFNRRDAHEMRAFY